MDSNDSKVSEKQNFSDCSCLACLKTFGMKPIETLIIGLAINFNFELTTIMKKSAQSKCHK